MNQPPDAFQRLMGTLSQRAVELPEGSYTTKLMRGGVVKIGGKITEEAAEVVAAAAEEGEAGRQHFVYEVGDLFFHTMVMMAYRGVTWDELERELARREGVSGLEEKKSREQQK